MIEYIEGIKGSVGTIDGEEFKDELDELFSWVFETIESLPGLDITIHQRLPFINVYHSSTFTIHQR
jgi:hypothetical protein